MNKLADEEQTITNTGINSGKQVFAAVIFAVLALLLASFVPSVETAWLSVCLIFAIYLFAFEAVGSGVAAPTIMVLLCLTALLVPNMELEQGLVDNNHLFDGISSNAVMSVIALMIIGAGLDKIGIMNKVAALILNIGGNSETRIIAVISVTLLLVSRQISD